MALKTLNVYTVWLALILILVAASCSHTRTGADTGQTLPVDLVYTHLDAANSRWFFFNSATRPFGMVNLSPDTEVNGTWGSGYRYNVDTIRCFSHIHAWQLSGIPVLPTTGKFKGHLGSDVYGSFFSHEKEVVRPGYHKVVLDDYGIAAELTSTARVGFLKGGTLKLVMGSEPNKEWATAPGAEPPSMSGTAVRK